MAFPAPRHGHRVPRRPAMSPARLAAFHLSSSDVSREAVNVGEQRELADARGPQLTTNLHADVLRQYDLRQALAALLVDAVALVAVHCERAPLHSDAGTVVRGNKSHGPGWQANGSVGSSKVLGGQRVGSEDQIRLSTAPIVQRPRVENPHCGIVKRRVMTDGEVEGDKRSCGPVQQACGQAPVLHDEVPLPVGGRDSGQQVSRLEDELRSDLVWVDCWVPVLPGGEVPLRTTLTSKPQSGLARLRARPLGDEVRDD